MHQQSISQDQEQPQPLWGGTSRTPAGPQVWGREPGAVLVWELGGDQSQQRTRPAGAAEAQDSRAAQREVFVQPWPVLRNQGHLLSHASPEALHTTGDVCGHSSHTELLGIRSVETERLVSPVSQFAECLKFFFQPAGTDNFFQPTEGTSVPDVQRGNGNTELQNCAQEPHSKYNRLELNVLTPS